MIDYGDQESKEIDEGDELQQSDEEQEIKNRNKPIINSVDKKDVEELINMRSNFGNINFKNLRNMKIILNSLNYIKINIQIHFYYNFYYLNNIKRCIISKY